MENKNHELDQLSNALQNEIGKNYKNKNAMKTLMITASQTQIGKTYNYELLNLIVSVVSTIYFVPRIFVFSDNTLLLTTGIISSVLWIFQSVYSYIGFAKISKIKHSEEPVIARVESIIKMIEYYTTQKKIYLWMAPITISAAIPIPLYEFRKIDLLNVFNTNFLIYLGIMVLMGIVFAIFLSSYFWKNKFEEPLKNAKGLLQELEE